MEVVKIKAEPTELLEEAENGSQSAENRPPDSNADGPEFVNIKMEIEALSPETSIKTEPPEDGETDKFDKSWSVPIVNPDCVLPDNCVEVSIKVEPNEELQYNAASDGDEGHYFVQPTTSFENLGPQHPGEVGLFCNICFKRFANPGNVQRHMLLHAERKFKCTECPKQFLSNDQLEKHSARHAYVPPEKNYICDHCNKQFKSSSNLMQHKRVHLAVKPFFCTQCHRSFAFKANLTKHQGKSRCKRPIDEPIKCNVCNKTFEKEFLLKSHLRRHETDRPFSCDQCSMNFKYKSTLIRHIQLHNGVRPFPCPFCDKSFTHSGLLKPHLRIHTGEKPYPCPICKKSFAHKHNMQRHAIRHNKIKHLVCDICHKKFPKESRLKYHMKTHVNEKHFSCQICPKKFSHKQNVLRHYTRKHPNAKYECKDTDASVALKVWDTIKSKYSDDPGEILG